MTWATGETLEAADSRMMQVKKERAAAGKRAANRDAAPPSLRERQTAERPPLLSVRQTPEYKTLWKRWLDLVGKNDEFSNRLRDRIDLQMKEILSAESDDSFARSPYGQRQSLLAAPRSKAELTSEFWAMPASARAVFEHKASEFWSALTGSRIVGLEVYLWEHGQADALEAKLPDFHRNSRGEMVPQHMSVGVDMLSRAIREGRIGPRLMAELEKTQKHFIEDGFGEVGLGEILMNRVIPYLDGLHMVGGPTPFSEEVNEYDRIEREMGEIPLLMNSIDGIGSERLYRNLKKGDRVEVIIEGKSVTATVISESGDSLLLNWADDVQVVDPDVRSSGQTARFSKKYGYQVSARYARGGLPYSQQWAAFPRQARMGRVWNEARKAWESEADVAQRIRNSIQRSKDGRSIHPTLARAYYPKTSKRDMKAIVDTVRAISRGLGNMPKISIVNDPSFVELHLQNKIVSVAGEARGVAGLWDDDDPQNGAYLFTAAIVDMARREKISIEQAAAETLIHEMVGHYGVRGLMGGMKQLERFTDVLHRSYGDEIMQVGIARGFASAQRDESGNFVTRKGADGKEQIVFAYASEEARRVSAEEWLAETIQARYVLGRPMEKPKQNFLRRIISYFRQLLSRSPFARYIRLGDADIANIIWQAHRFVHSGRAFRFVKSDGQVISNFTKDADIFISAFARQFDIGTRPTTKDERAQMKKAGKEPVAEVPLFPEEGLTRQGYIQAFQKLLSDNKISKAEFEYMNPEELMELVTPDAMVMWGLENDLPTNYRLDVRRMSIIGMLEGGRNASSLKPEIEQRIRQLEARLNPEAVGDALEDADPAPEWMQTLFPSSVLGPVPGPSEEEKAEINARLADARADLAIVEADLDPERGRRWLLKEKAEIADRLAAPMDGKKLKIPKSAVRKAVESKALAVIPSISGGYNLSESNWEAHAQLDINAQNWLSFAGSEPSYGNSAYWPIGSVPAFPRDADDPSAASFDEGSYFAYVLYQTSPKNPGYNSGHGFGTPVDNSRKANGGQFAHIRAAMRKESDGSWTYVVAETQSDAFQSQENAFDSVNQQRIARDIAKYHRSAMQRATREFSRALGESFGEFVRTAISEYEALGGLKQALIDLSKNYYDNGTIDKVGAEQVRRHVVDAVNAKMDGILLDDADSPYAVRQRERKKLLEVLEMSKADARLFRYLDDVAFVGTFNALKNKVIYGIEQALSTEPPDFQAFSVYNIFALDGKSAAFDRGLGEIMADHIDTLADSRRGMAAHRVAAKKDLRLDMFKTFLYGVRGVNPEQLAAQVEDAMRAASKVETVTIDITVPPFLRREAHSSKDDGGMRFVKDVYVHFASTLEASGLIMDMGTMSSAPDPSRPDTFNVSLNISRKPGTLAAKMSDKDLVATFASLADTLLKDGEYLDRIQNRVRSVNEFLAEDTSAAAPDYEDVPEDLIDELFEEMQFSEADDMYSVNIGSYSWGGGTVNEEETFEAAKDRIQNNGVESEIFEFEELYFAGRKLDTDHPEYIRILDDNNQDREEDDEWDTEAADDWLRDTQYEVFWEEAHDRNSDVYRAVMEYASERGIEVFNEPGEQAGWEFRYPTSFDEDGEPDAWEDGSIAVGLDDSDGDPVYDRWVIFFNDVEVDYWFDMDKAKRTVYQETFRRVRAATINSGNPPRRGSIWDPARLAAAAGYDNPEMAFAPVAQFKVPETIEGAATVNVEDSFIEEEEFITGDIEKSWEQLVLRERASESGVLRSPLKKAWKQAVWKFILADATRRGAKRIFMHHAEASGSRGGWGSPAGHGGATEVNAVRWAPTTYEYGGRQFPAFIIKPPAGVYPTSEMIVTRDRLPAIVGMAAAKRIIDEADNPERYAADQEEAKRAAHIKSVSLGDGRYVVADEEAGNLLGVFTNPEDAERTRAAAAEKWLAESSMSPVPGSNEGLVYRHLTSKKLGGSIYLSTGGQVEVEYYDTVVPSGRLSGARTGYDVVNVSTANSLVRKVGSEMKPGRLEIKPRQIREARNRDGAIVMAGDMTYEQATDLFSIETISKKFMVLGPEGTPVTSELFDTYNDALSFVQERRDELFTERGIHPEIMGWEIEVTDQMRQAYGSGGIAILSTNRPTITRPADSGTNERGEMKSTVLRKTLEAFQKRWAIAASDPAMRALNPDQMNVMINAVARERRGEEVWIPATIVEGIRRGVEAAESLMISRGLSPNLTTAERARLVRSGGQVPAQASQPGQTFAPMPRTAWPTDFPKVFAATTEEGLRNTPEYQAAKNGDVTAATKVARALVTDAMVEQIRKRLGDQKPKIVPVVAQNGAKKNKLPIALATVLAQRLGLEVETNVVQSNMPMRTGSGVNHRLANHPRFATAEGFTPSESYLIVDDVITTGGTIAGLRGYLETETGGKVLGVSVLGARSDRLVLPVTDDTIRRIRQKLGSRIDTILQEELGYGLERFTEGEARALLSSESADEVRTRIAGARIGGGRGQGPGTPEGPVTGGGSMPLLSMGRYKDPHLDSAAQKIGVQAPKAPLRQRVNDMLDYARLVANQKLFDRMAGIKAAMDRASWSGPAEENPYIQARLTTSLDGQMRAVLEQGHPIWQDGIMQTAGKGLLEILEPVSNPEKLNLWALYMVGKRAKRLMDEGREHLFTADEIQAMLDVGNMSQIFEDVAVEYAAFNSKVLDFAEAAGIINPTTRAMWENSDYIPFYRVQDERLIGPHAAGNGIANQRSPIKELKGGTAALGDPVTNIIVNLSSLIETSMKNHAATIAVDALSTSGIMTKIPSIQYDTALVPMAQVKQKLVAAGLNPSLIPQNVLTGFQQMFIARPPKGPGIISVMRGGKPEFWHTTDELLFESMTMFNQKRFGGWMKLFSGPKRFLTSMITLDPGFMIRNYIRDLVSSHVLSRDVHSPLTHLAKSVEGFAQAALNDDSMKIIRAAGGAFDLGYVNVGDIDSTRRAIRKAMRKKGFRQSVLDTPAKVFEFYTRFGAAFENANRIAVYNEARAAGKSKAQAVFEAKDLMDFSMSGSSPVIQFLVQSVPFMGARLQGLQRLGRGIHENPVGFALKGLFWTLAGMALFLQYHDDERYKALELWDKATYFHFWIGDHHFRIPKGFEVGSIFNTLPEMFTERWMSEEGDANKTLMKGLAHVFGSTFSMNPIPQIAMPMIESAFNYDFFTQRGITTPYEENRLPPEQFSPQTSPLMVELARALPEWMNDVTPKMKSPKHLENLYRGYTGTLGQYVLMAADAVVRHAMDYPAAPARRLQDYPVIGSFYRGSDDAAMRQMYEEAFYTTLRKAQQVKGSMSFLEKYALEGRMDKTQSDYEAIIAITPTLEDIREQVSDLNKEMMMVWMDQEMTPQEKRSEVDLIQREKNELFRDAYPLRKGGAEHPRVTEETLNFFLKEFNVDRLPEILARRQAPMLGDLVADVMAIEDPDTVRALTRGAVNE